MRATAGPSAEPVAVPAELRLHYPARLTRSKQCYRQEGVLAAGRIRARSGRTLFSREALDSKGEHPSREESGREEEELAEGAAELSTACDRGSCASREQRSSS